MTRYLTDPVEPSFRYRAESISLTSSNVGPDTVEQIFLDKHMIIAAAHISADALNDMFQLYDAQPWVKQLHEELTELWSICSSRHQQILVRDLIKEFCMFDAELEAIACKKFNQQIHAWELKPNTTWIVAVANSNEVDGSTAGLQKLKNKVLPYESWHSRFISNIPSAGGVIKNGDHIVLFDDFIGTGKKMLRKIGWLSDILNERGIEEFSISCACFSGMEFGIRHLAEQSNVPVFSSIFLKRGISERYTGDELTSALAHMKELEDQLAPAYKGKKLTDYTLGYEKSESLYCAINDNCPNNVFPILWWAIRRNNTPFKTLLQRAG